MEIVFLCVAFEKFQYLLMLKISTNLTAQLVRACKIERFLCLWVSYNIYLFIQLVVKATLI